MLKEFLTVIKETFDLDELYIVESNVAREGFYTFTLLNTPYFLQVSKHLPNKSVFNIKRLIETMLSCDEERLNNKQKLEVLEETFEKVLNVSDDSTTLNDIIQDSFSFAGEGVNIAIFLKGDLISNSGIDYQVLLPSYKKLQMNSEFATLLEGGEHLGYSAEHIKLVVISKKRIDPFIKWAFKMKLLWLDHIYKGKLADQENIRAVETIKLRDKFISVVSHDLRSPFTGIMGIMKVLHSDQVNPLNQEQKKLLGTAIDGSYQLIEMIGNLLDISRLQTGEFMVTPKLIQTQGLVNAVLGEFLSLVAKKRICLVNEIPESASVYGDYDLLCILLRNLISNAIKFCKTGDSITILTYSKGSISVKDTGTGIKEDILSDLFKREVKTSTPGTDGEDGTGLGLPLCYDIIEAHGGELTVESKQGEGTLFTATLPVKKTISSQVE